MFSCDVSIVNVTVLVYYCNALLALVLWIAYKAGKIPVLSCEMLTFVYLLTLLVSNNSVHIFCF